MINMVVGASIVIIGQTPATSFMETKVIFDSRTYFSLALAPEGCEPATLRRWTPTAPRRLPVNGFVYFFSLISLFSETFTLSLCTHRLPTFRFFIVTKSWREAHTHYETSQDVSFHGLEAEAAGWAVIIGCYVRASALKRHF